MVTGGVGLATGADMAATGEKIGGGGMSGHTSPPSLPAAASIPPPPLPRILPLLPAPSPPLSPSPLTPMATDNHRHPPWLRPPPPAGSFGKESGSDVSAPGRGGGAPVT